MRIGCFNLHYIYVLLMSVYIVLDIIVLIVCNYKKKVDYSGNNQRFKLVKHPIQLNGLNTKWLLK